MADAFDRRRLPIGHDVSREGDTRGSEETDAPARNVAPYMPAHAAQGLTCPANRQPNERNRADEDGVAAEGPLELAVMCGQTHNVSHSNELANSPTIRSAVIGSEIAAGGVPARQSASAARGQFLVMHRFLDVLQRAVQRWFVADHDGGAARDCRFDADAEVASVVTMPMWDVDEHSAPEDVRVELFEPGDPLADVCFERIAVPRPRKVIGPG
jgi:hypothetical protein